MRLDKYLKVSRLIKRRTVPDGTAPAAGTRQPNSIQLFHGTAALGGRTPHRLPAGAGAPLPGKRPPTARRVPINRCRGEGYVPRRNKENVNRQIDNHSKPCQSIILQKTNSSVRPPIAPR